MTSTIETKDLAKREFGIPHVRTELWNPEKQREIPFLVGNGYIGKDLTPAEEMRIEVNLKVEPGLYFMGFELDERTSNVRELQCHGSVNEGLKFCRTIRIARNPQGYLYVDRHSNNIRLACMAPDGQCVMWNIAMICQDGHFFLTFQTIFNLMAYADGKKVRIPGTETVKKWRPLGMYLGAELAVPEVRSGLELQDFTKYVPVKGIEYEDGQVIRYSLRQQSGCIQTNKGQARVLWQNIKTKRDDGLRYLVEGEHVDYNLATTDDSRSAFQWDAWGVSVRE